MDSEVWRAGGRAGPPRPVSESMASPTCQCPGTGSLGFGTQAAAINLTSRVQLGARPRPSLYDILYYYMIYAYSKAAPVISYVRTMIS
jgi:hypothetical protein